MTSYIDHQRGPDCDRGQRPWDIRISWPKFTHRRLAWLYGADRAIAIRAGRDPKTQADIARWNALGRKDAA